MRCARLPRQVRFQYEFPLTSTELLASGRFDRRLLHMLRKIDKVNGLGMLAELREERARLFALFANHPGPARNERCRGRGKSHPEQAHRLARSGEGERFGPLSRWALQAALEAGLGDGAGVCARCVDYEMAGKGPHRFSELSSEICARARRARQPGRFNYELSSTEIRPEDLEAPRARPLSTRRNAT